MKRYIDSEKLIAEIEQRITNFSIMHNTAASKKDYESMSRVDCVIVQLRKVLEFVKSLQQEQSNWKPSKKQMEALNAVANEGVLLDLFNDLLKLF